MLTGHVFSILWPVPCYGINRAPQIRLRDVRSAACRLQAVTYRQPFMIGSRINLDIIHQTLQQILCCCHVSETQ